MKYQRGDRKNKQLAALNKRERRRIREVGHNKMNPNSKL